MEDCIIYSLDDELPSSPPRSLLPLMLTCRNFYNLLHPSNNPRLYRRIFCRKFDIAALVRRLPPSSIVASRFFPELKRRFQAMRCIKTGDIHHPDLQNSLLVAYIMVLENDALNHHHLLDACLPALLDKYLAERLYRGHNLWPIEDTCNALAVALFWHMTSQGAWAIVLHLLPFGESAPLPPSGALDGESNDSRDKVLDVMLPLTFAWFQYSFAEQGFDPYMFVNGTSSTPWPSPRLRPPLPPAPVTASIDYMGHALDLRLPVIALSASLAYFARLDAFHLALPPFLPLSRPHGQDIGLSVEDLEHYNHSFHACTVPRSRDTHVALSNSPHTCHDWDWLRAVAPDQITSSPLRRYTPGILTGEWGGIFLAPYERDFTPFMTGEAGPASLPGQSRFPLFCTLEEHVRYSSLKSCASGDVCDDPSNIPPFPPTMWTQKEDGIELFDGSSSTKAFYKTFNRESSGEAPGSVQRDSESDAGETTRADQEITDVILSGRTEVDLRPAWGNYEYTGRVRISDGLVVLVRQQLNQHGGRVPNRKIFTGYVLSSQNFVGKWKHYSPGAQWEGVWSLCKTK